MALENRPPQHLPVERPAVPGAAASAALEDGGRPMTPVDDVRLKRDPDDRVEVLDLEASGAGVRLGIHTSGRYQLGGLALGCATILALCAMGSYFSDPWITAIGLPTFFAFYGMHELLLRRRPQR